MADTTGTQSDIHTLTEATLFFFNSCMFKIQVASTLEQRRVKGCNKTNSSSAHEKKQNKTKHNIASKNGAEGDFLYVTVTHTCFQAVGCHIGEQGKPLAGAKLEPTVLLSARTQRQVVHIIRLLCFGIKHSSEIF